jgi:hypothetical protein
MATRRDTVKQNAASVLRFFRAELTPTAWLLRQTILHFTENKSLFCLFVGFFLGAFRQGLYKFVQCHTILAIQSAALFIALSSPQRDSKARTGEGLQRNGQQRKRLRRGLQR